jgi:hypothetical protein
MDLIAMSTEERQAAVTAATDEVLSTTHAEYTTRATEMFALTTATVEQANEAEALMASIGVIETEQASREATVADAAARFAAAREQFSAATAEAVEVVEEPEAEVVEPEAEETEEGEESETEEGEEVEADGEATVTAAASRSFAVPARKPSAAARIGAKTPRPVARATSPVTITAAADIPNVAMGSPLESLHAVAMAAQNRAQAFPQFDLGAAQAVNSQTGGAPKLHKFAVASFKTEFDKSHKGDPFSNSKDYGAVTAARKDHAEALKRSLEAAKSGKDATLRAAGWCAPSPIVYDWIADYVVDGLLSLPEVDAPRGGLQTTVGPQLLQTTFADPANFGFGGTEAQAIAGYTKTCETIECPDFVDNRLDFVGYCWKIPILTESAFPELIADALRLSDVAYAHKMNARFINDIWNMSDPIATNGLGAVFLDTLEAFTQIAVRERRWWNVGVNAMMEVKLPQIALDIFKFDMARRSGLALNDLATEQKIAAHFANHNLAVEYLADFQDESGFTGAVAATWPDTLKAIIYPAGTFVKAVKDVINMSAVYDAASLSVNEYTGVFFEQGVKTIKMGYRSHRIEVPVCAAGVTGANALDCLPGSL